MTISALEKQRQDEISNASRAGVSGAVKQKVAITDIISEGPIEGLVEGTASVYLNDDRIISSTTHRTFSDKIDGAEMVVTNGSKSVTLQGVTLDSYSSGSTLIKRVATFKNIYTSTVSLGAVGISGIEEPTINITTTSSFFTTDMVKEGTGNVAYGRLRIPTLDIDLEGNITTRTSGTAAVFTPTSKNASYVSYFKSKAEFETVKIELDIRAEIDFSDPDNLALIENWQYTSGTYSVNLGSPIIRSATGINHASAANVNSTNVEFRPGTLNQKPLSSMYGLSGTAISNSSFSSQALEKNDAHSNDTDPNNAANPPVIKGSASNGFDLTSAQIAEVDTLRIQFTYSSLFAQSEKDGKKYDVSARYKIEFIPIKEGVDQTSIILAHRVHKGLYETPVTFEEFIYTEALRPFDDFKVKITRETRHDGRRVRGDGTEGKNPDKMQASCSVTRVTAVIKERVNYPLTALARVSFDSKDYSNVPKRTYHCRGLKVKVPSNYTTREESVAAGNGQALSDLYSGLWDGDFRDDKVYTNNPAWILYDIMTNNRYGLGTWLEETDIDKYQLYRIGRYCDELVDDGKGGTEPRYTCNAYITKPADAYKILKDFTTTFLGILYWMDGKVFAVADQPTDPIYTFSKSNVLNGEFSYQGTSSKVRPNQMTVMWNNPSNNYELEPLLIEDKENIAKTGKLIREKAVAFGCTSEGQAYRYGKWKLWTAINQKEVVSFKTSINATFLSPGDVIKVQDADLYDIAYSGRITGTPTTTTIPLDRSVTLNSGSTYELSCIFEDSSTENGGTNQPKNTKVVTETVSTGAGTVTSLTVDTAFPSAPTKGSVFVLREEITGGVSDASEKEYKIVSVSEDSMSEYSITAVEYFDEKYNAIEGDFTLATETRVAPEITADEPVYAPANIYMYPAQDPSKAGNEVMVRWDFPKTPDGDLSDNVKGFEIYHNVSDLETPIYVNAGKTQYLFTDVPDGNIRCSVYTIDSIGKRSEGTPGQLEVTDVYKLKIPRAAEGVPIGGNASSALELNGSYVLDFLESSPSISPAGDPTTVDSGAVTGLNTIHSNISNGTHFALFDSSASAIKAVEYKTGTDIGINYWRDIVANDDFTSGTGTVSVDADSNRVKGTSTTFESQYATGDIIKFSSTKAAKVTNVVSDTLLIVDRSFDTAISASSHEYLSLKIDFEKDTIIAEFTKSGSTSTFKTFTGIDYSLNADNLGISLSGDSISINDSGTSITGNAVTQSGLEQDATITSGGIVMSSGGRIQGGQTGYDTGTGFFLGYSTDAYKFSIGNSSGDRLTFDGSDLAVTGSITADSGSIGGVNINSSKLYLGTGTFDNSNTAFYLDDSGQFSLKDKLSFDGTNLEVEGSLTVDHLVFSDDIQYSGDFTAPIDWTDANYASQIGADNLDISVTNLIDERIADYGLGSEGDFGTDEAVFSKFAGNPYHHTASISNFDHGTNDVVLTMTAAKTWSLYTLTSPIPNNEANNNFTLTLQRKKSADSSWTTLQTYTRDGSSGIVGGNYVLGQPNTYYNGITIDLEYTDVASGLEDNVDYDYQLVPSNTGSNYRFDVRVTFEANEAGTASFADIDGGTFDGS